MDYRKIEAGTEKQKIPVFCFFYKIEYMQLENICTKVNELVQSTGDFILGEKNKINDKVIESKGTHDFVTYVDKTAEKLLVEGLSSILPEAGFIAEEGTANQKGETYDWIIDPLDGTTNYIHGLSPFAISVALRRKDKIILGVVYEMSLKELFYSWENAPAYLNRKAIKVSSVSEMHTALIATGFPYYQFDDFEQYMFVLMHFMKNSAGIRRLGSAATDLAYLAAGRFEAFFESALHAWDVAAGAFIVQQAGGKITDYNGGDNWLFGGQIVAGNSMIYEEFFKFVNQKLGSNG